MSGKEILKACLESGDDAAWAAFVARFGPLISASVVRVIRAYNAPTFPLADDLVQETYVRICKDNYQNLRRFKATHEDAIFGYLKVIATSVAMDHFRNRTTLKRRGEVEDDGNHPEAARPSEVEQKVLLEEIDRHLLMAGTERDRTVFWLYYRQGFTANEISAIPSLGLTAKGVESCIYRATLMLRAILIQEPSRQKGLSAAKTLGMVE